MTKPSATTKRAALERKGDDEGKRRKGDKRRHVARTGEAPAPAVAQADATAAAHGNKVDFTWSSGDPKFLVKVDLAEDGQPNAFRLRSKDDTRLFCEQMRFLGQSERLNIPAWICLSRQVNELLPVAPSKDELRNWRRVRVQADKLVNRAAHRRRRMPPDGVVVVNPKQHAGFKRRLRVSDAFVDFAVKCGADWSKGQFHSRSNCGTLLHRHIRINNLRVKKAKTIKVDDVLAPLVPPEEIDADGAIQSSVLQKLLTRHCGQTIPEPTSCVGDLPTEDDDGLPQGFTKPQPLPKQPVVHSQFARVTQLFAESIIVGQPLLDGWKADDLHSRSTCAALLERYCTWKDLRLPNGTDDKGRAVVRYSLDPAITELFTSVGLPVPTELTRTSIRNVVGKHATGDPTNLPSLCPPLKDHIDNERVKIPPLPKPPQAATESDPMPVDGEQ